MPIDYSVTTAIDWTFRDGRPDDGNHNQPNRRAKVLLLADLTGGQFVFPYDVASDRFEEPILVTAFFKDLPWSRIDSGVNWGNGKVYLFHEDHYARYDIGLKRVEYALPIAGYWPGIPFNRIDAALNYGNGKAYFFHEDKYVRYDMGRDRVDPAYHPPLSIAGYWPGIPWNRIGAAVNWGNGKVYFFHGSDYVRYDIVTDRTDTKSAPVTLLKMGTSGLSSSDFYSSIETIARTLEGSHYLWGSTGASPHGWQGNRVRPNLVKLVSPQRVQFGNPAIFAAECAADPKHRHQVCGGKYDRVAGGAIIQQLNLAEQGLLQTYLNGLALLEEKDWHAYGLDLSLSPRVMVEIAASFAVLGEDCRHKRHFDCIGFVNYCIEMATARTTRLPISFSIEQWADLKTSGTMDVPLGDPAHPGDILIRDSHHIGLLAGNGEVIQAAETKSGVIINSYVPSKWSRRRRVPTSLFNS